MKIKTFFGLIISGMVFLVAFSSCSDGDQGKEGASTVKYTCPMHPQIIKDGPGSCPICGMDLVPVNSPNGSNELSLSESQIQLANIKTVKVSSGSFTTSKVVNARLITNPEGTELISSRYAGRIEKLFIKETGRSVANGQPLFQVYSEELQTLQQDYLLQQRQAAAFPEEKIYRTLAEAARNKLRLFGYSNAQIQALSRSNRTSPLITVNSSASGIVTEINISEGQYVSEGSQLIRLENFDHLWVEGDIYPNELANLKPGTSIKVSIDGISNSEQSVKIDFISPQMDPLTQIVKIRAPVHNSGTLRAGMQASILLPVSESASAVTLPIDAVLRDESGAHVWIKTGKNTFSPRMVTTGEEDADQIIIRSGLEDVNEVVVSGAYLLSSEFILKKGSDPHAGHGMDNM